MERGKPRRAANAPSSSAHSIKPIGGAAKMLITRKDSEKERARVREIEVSKKGRIEKVIWCLSKGNHSTASCHASVTVSALIIKLSGSMINNTPAIRWEESMENFQADGIGIRAAPKCIPKFQYRMQAVRCRCIGCPMQARS